MKPNKGLNLDARPEDQAEGTYPFGKNGMQFNIKEAVTNEPGFEAIVRQAVPYGYQVNGILPTDNDRVILFFTNNTYSCIKVVDVGTGVTVFSFSDQTKTYRLGFNVDNYIIGQVQKNYRGQLVCAFTDKKTFPKFINFDEPQTDFLKEWNLFPECSFPTVTKSFQYGGYLAVGSYFFATRYYKTDGTMTGFSPVTSGIVVTSDGPQNVLNAAGVIVDKSIQLLLTDMDQSYDFVEVAVLSRIQGVTKAVLLNRVPVLPGSTTVTYSGTETTTTASVEEVLVNPIFYDRVHTMGQLNDALYLGKLERTNEILDMQPYANQVQLMWQSELIDVSNAPEEHKSGQKKGLMHQEVYAFYIRYKLANGTNSIAYHIPGAEADSVALAISSVATTGTLANTPVFKAEDCINTFSTSSKIGIPGAYLNDTELYPITNDFDSSSLGGVDLRGLRVRHHKMPSLKWCKENLYPTETEYGSKKLDILGIRALNVIIPPQYAGVIVGYEILYAKRTLSNMTVYGQGLALYGATTITSATEPKVHSNGHNWTVASTYQTKVPNQSFLRFHAFDLLFNRPGIAPSFTSAQYKLSIPLDVRIKSYSYPTGSSIASAKGMTTVLLDGYLASVAAAQTNNINALVNTKYVLNATTMTINESTPSGLFTEYNNSFLETHFAGRLMGPALPFTTGASSDGSGNYTGTVSEAYLTNLCDTKVNVYENFYTQELVSAGDPKILTDNSPFWGGDIFVCPYTFHTYGILDYFWGVQTISGTDFPLDVRGRRVVNRVVCETISNLYTRFEQSGNIYSKWYPNNPLEAFSLVNNYTLDFNGGIDPNQFGYSRGAEGINDFLPDSIYNPYQTYLSKFFYRIHRGGKLSRENTRSWRTFLALDYYEMQKNMGEIEHLEGMDDRLLIHMTNSLFVTQDKGKLEGGMLTVTLGSGDIFQFEPQEVLSSKLGYGGVQSDLATIRTPVGYIFADVKQGEFYAYKDKQLQMINGDIYRFLKEYLSIRGKNVFTGNGVTLGWDQKYRRVLATVKNWRPLDPKASVVVINGPEDILEIATVLGPPNYPDTLVTVNGFVKPGDIVFMNGRYLKYSGINNLTPGAESPYSCPEEPGSCPSVTSVDVDASSDPPFAHVTWVGTASLYYIELYELGPASAMTLIYSGNTSSLFQDFDDSLLDPNKVYYFTVRAVCDNGLTSIPVSTSFSIQEPPVIIVSPPGSTVIHYHPRGDYSVWQKYRLTVNGTVLGIYNLSLTGTGPSQYIATPGYLNAATVKIELLNAFDVPVTIPGLAGVPMYDSALNSIPAVVSAGNTLTWTGVDISPSFLTYVHLYTL